MDEIIMKIVFEIKDKTGRKIRLTKEQWKHITEIHSEMANYLSEIQKAIEKPLKIIFQEKGNLFRYYFYIKQRKHPEKYLRVIVKYLNGDGFILTAHFVRNLV